jgi:hypothetical protein
VLCWGQFLQERILFATTLPVVAFTTNQNEHGEEDLQELGRDWHLLARRRVPLRKISRRRAPAAAQDWRQRQRFPVWRPRDGAWRVESDMRKIQPALIKHGLMTTGNLLGYLKDECGGVTSDGLKQMGISEYGPRTRILERLERKEQEEDQANLLALCGLMVCGALGAVLRGMFTTTAGFWTVALFWCCLAGALGAFLALVFGALTRILERLKPKIFC